MMSSLYLQANTYTFQSSPVILPQRDEKERKKQTERQMEIQHNKLQEVYHSLWSQGVNAMPTTED